MMTILQIKHIKHTETSHLINHTYTFAVSLSPPQLTIPNTEIRFPNSTKEKAQGNVLSLEG